MNNRRTLECVFKGFAVQKALPVFESMALATEQNATHFYVEGSSKEDNASMWNEAKLAAVREHMRANALSAIYHGNYRNPLANEIPEIRRAAVRYIKQEVDIAAELNAPLIVHGSCIFTHKNVLPLLKKANEDFADGINEIASYAAEKGVEVWLENLEYYRNKHPFHTVFSKNDDYRSVFARIDRSVRFIIDIGHENISSNRPAETFREHAERVVAISLSDNDGIRDSHSDLGDGNLDFRAVLEEIKNSEWTGYLTVETRGGNLADCLDYLESAAGTPECAPARKAKG